MSENGATPESVAFISPSISSSIGVNPSMRVFTFEEDTYELLDFEQYYIHLDVANRGLTDLLESCYLI